MELKNFIKDVPDYPKPGVSFKDITPLLGNREAFKFAVDSLVEKFSHSVILSEAKNPTADEILRRPAPQNDNKIDIVVGIDARGFLLAAPVAYKLGAGLAIVRKPGKLPRQCVREDYVLEYASNSLEMHADAILPGQKVLIVDDVLATGGTAEAAVKLIKKLGGEIAGILFLIELEFLKGRKKLEGCDVQALIKY